MKRPCTSAEDAICLTIDTEWAHPDILGDLLDLIEAAGVRATLFCTHAGIEARDHEIALHPNFRKSGDILSQVEPEELVRWTEEEAYNQVVAKTKQLYPEAIGVRSHALFYDSALPTIYAEAGLKYDSSTCLTLAPNLSPVLKEGGLVEFPIYYMDHIDIRSAQTAFRVGDLGVHRPGLKVFDFHPNIVYINAESEHHYESTRADYHNPSALMQARCRGRGIRTLLLEFLETIVSQNIRTKTLAELYGDLAIEEWMHRNSPLEVATHV